jgi:hypothetical protein
MGPGYELGRAVDFLIKEGHDEGRVWKYTPREIKGWIDFAARRKHHERREATLVAMHGARGDPKELKKMLAKMEKDGQ